MLLPVCPKCFAKSHRLNSMPSKIRTWVLSTFWCQTKIEYYLPICINYRIIMNVASPEETSRHNANNACFTNKLHWLSTQLWLALQPAHSEHDWLHNAQHKSIWINTMFIQELIFTREQQRSEIVSQYVAAGCQWKLFQVESGLVADTWIGHATSFWFRFRKISVQICCPMCNDWQMCNVWTDPPAMYFGLGFLEHQCYFHFALAPTPAHQCRCDTATNSCQWNKPDRGSVPPTQLPTDIMFSSKQADTNACTCVQNINVINDVHIERIAPEELEWDFVRAGPAGYPLLSCIQNNSNDNSCFQCNTSHMCCNLNGFIFHAEATLENSNCMHKHKDTRISKHKHQKTCAQKRITPGTQHQNPWTHR